MRGSAATATSPSARRRRPSGRSMRSSEGDALFASYRDHATALAVGSPAAAVMAELFGKDTGVAHGRGGSMHLLDVERRFFGGWGIVGAHLPIATGAALAFAHRGEPHAVLCQFGDGAMATGAYHEALNLASVWHLPIVFQVINNQYGMGTRVDQSNAEPELRQAGGGLPHARRARRRKRRPGGPRGRVEAARDRPATSAGRRCSRPSRTATAATPSPTRARSTAPPRRCSRGASAIRSRATGCSSASAGSRRAPTSRRSGRTSPPR